MTTQNKNQNLKMKSCSREKKIQLTSYLVSTCLHFALCITRRMHAFMYACIYLCMYLCMYVLKYNYMFMLYQYSIPYIQIVSVIQSIIFQIYKVLYSLIYPKSMVSSSSYIYIYIFLQFIHGFKWSIYICTYVIQHILFK